MTAGRDTEGAYDLGESFSSASVRSCAKGDGEKVGFAGIRVTTFVTQESSPRSPDMGMPGDDAGYMRDLMNKEIFGS